MAITTAQRAKINKMNRASQDVSLGTIVQDLQSGCAVNAAYRTTNTAIIASSGSLTCAGSQIFISTGLATIHGYVIQCNRSGSCATLPLYAWSGSVAGTLRITSASGVNALTTTDVVTWFAF
jgi:hypothetical protein